MSVIVQSISTVVLFAAFLALWFHAWRKERSADYSAAANLPLEDTSAATADSSRAGLDA